MVMFVLIQFDVYGYDLIYASRCADDIHSVVMTDDEVSITESCGQISEWSDPVYRNTSIRFYTDIISPVISTPLFFFCDSGRSINPKFPDTIYYIPDCQQYIMFGVLLI